VDVLTQWSAGRSGPALPLPGLLVTVALCIAQGFGSAQQVEEYELKAAFLYKFASFVEWPGGLSEGPVCIGIIGDDPFGAVLDRAISGKAVSGRRFVVKRFRFGQDTEACQILFVSSSEKKRMRAALNRVPTLGTLTVGEMPGFCENGGIINFETANNMVRFEINLEAAERAQLKISSKLINVARPAHREVR
jgi:hypothetical protein